jgi:hypothetical protein
MVVRQNKLVQVQVYSAVLRGCARLRYRLRYYEGMGASSGVLMKRT